MRLHPYNIHRIADRYLSLQFNDEPSLGLTLRLKSVARAISKLAEVEETSFGHQTILVEASPGKLDAVLALVHQLEAFSEELPIGRHWNVHCLYDGEDLEWLSEANQLSVDQIIRLHSGISYGVLAIGSPRFIYLSSVNERLHVPRLANPRQAVPGLSVAIGGKQTGIYGSPRPGGWRLMGSIDELPRLSPGDTVRFIPK